MKNEPIYNRVANSPLITIDLKEYRPKESRFFFDLKDILDESKLIREKNVRQFIKEHDWNKYLNQYVAVGCSLDIVLPSWTKLIICAAIKPYAKKVIIGDLEQLEISIFDEIINNFDFNKYLNKPVIIKGCTDTYIPDSAYGLLINKLQQFAKKISYGEACSSVPLWSSNK
ncbi:MAG: hypothetical protein CMC81_01655 [Flavobacteriaceae bacterium]|nr:hypothetical protein [Flavobacteriaceae bacterium]